MVETRWRGVDQEYWSGVEREEWRGERISNQSDKSRSALIKQSISEQAAWNEGSRVERRTM